MAPHIGKRIAQARKAAGWTQAQLSQRTCFSVQLVSAVEQGRKPASHAFTTAAARALHTDLQWLLAQDRVHRQHDPDQPGAPAAELRAVMDAWDDPGIDGPPAPLPELEAGLTRAEQLRRLGRYDGVLATLLPELLRALYVHARDAVPGSSYRSFRPSRTRRNISGSCMTSNGRSGFAMGDGFRLGSGAGSGCA